MSNLEKLDNLLKWKCKQCNHYPSVHIEVKKGRQGSDHSVYSLRTFIRKTQGSDHSACSLSNIHKIKGRNSPFPFTQQLQ